MDREESGHPGRGYFSWSLRTDGTPNSEMPAPDGEEYFAMSLYFAAGRWGNGSGIYDYLSAADRLLTDMRHRETVTGPTSKGVRTAGNMFHRRYAMVRLLRIPTSPIPLTTCRVFMSSGLAGVLRPTDPFGCRQPQQAGSSSRK